MQYHNMKFSEPNLDSKWVEKMKQTIQEKYGDGADFCSQHNLSTASVTWLYWGYVTDSDDLLKVCEILFLDTPLFDRKPY